MSEVVDISPGDPDSSLCFIQPSISHDLLCIRSELNRVTMMHFFPNFEPVWFSMFASNCCFLTCIQVSQEAGKVVWYSSLFQNFPQSIVVHTGFGIVNKAETDIFLELLLFSMI